MPRASPERLQFFRSQLPDPRLRRAAANRSYLASARSTLAAGLQRPDLKALMGRGWVVHFRAPPLRLKPPVRFLPVRQLFALLLPMDESGFIAPLQQAAHRHPMRSGHHEGLHGGFARPQRTGPERAIAIAQQRNAQISLGAPGLPGASNRRIQKRRKIPP